uniref:Uncharacterized protein n=1 Tax=Arundo donax TaxID=35708 RepID=A0A0A8ZGQ2_ARUDO
MCFIAAARRPLIRSFLFFQALLAFYFIYFIPWYSCTVISHLNLLKYFSSLLEEDLECSV